MDGIDSFMNRRLFGPGEGGSPTEHVAVVLAFVVVVMPIRASGLLIMPPANG